MHLGRNSFDQKGHWGECYKDFQENPSHKILVSLDRDFQKKKKEKGSIAMNGQQL